MNRRDFIKTTVLSSAGLKMAKADSFAQSQKVQKRKILAWSHIYLDFQGDDDSVRKEFSSIKDSGIDLLMIFVHSLPEENQAWYDSTLNGFTKKNKLSRLLKISKEIGLDIQPIVGSITDVGLSKAVRARRSYHSGLPEGHPKDGRFCASWEGNRLGGIKIALDILEHHPVAGIHLDYVRYIDTDIGLKFPCQCEACQENYQRLFGKMKLNQDDLSSPGVLYKYLQFRNSNITTAVNQYAKISKQYRVELSMAARADYFNSALVEGQDWIKWAKEGFFDFICPMNYSLDRGWHRNTLKLQLELIAGTIPIYSGIGRKWSGGENNIEEVIRQAEDALNLGASGISIFHYNGLTSNDLQTLKSFRKSIG